MSSASCVANVPILRYKLWSPSTTNSSSKPARTLAELAFTTVGNSTKDRLAFISKRLLARDFTSEELAILEISLSDLLAYYGQNLEDAEKLLNIGESPANQQLPPAELAAWTMLTNEMMNLDEVLCK